MPRATFGGVTFDLTASQPHLDRQPRRSEWPKALPPRGVPVRGLKNRTLVGSHRGNVRCVKCLTSVPSRYCAHETGGRGTFPASVGAEVMQPNGRARLPKGSGDAANPRLGWNRGGDTIVAKGQAGSCQERAMTFDLLLPGLQGVA
jgi:hypothetical protein